MARQLAAAQHHLFWNTAKERECCQRKGAGHHSPWPSPLHGAWVQGREGDKAYSEPYYLLTMGCAVGVVDVDIVMWPCPAMRFH